ncbi:MAG: hypothetical protein FWD65_08000 [Coriobacteriia bacterium]|nr:hypothetical protein [Coriobacteriia bacterium]
MRGFFAHHRLLRRGLILAAIFVVSLGLAVGSLTAVRSLPGRQGLTVRVKDASQLLMGERPYDSPLSRTLRLPFTNYPWSRDNGTDATMLSVMLPQAGRASALHEVADDPWAQLTQPYKPQSYPQQAIPSLAARLTGGPAVQTTSYARYWHGYQLITQPLLRVMSYAQTRILNAVLLALCLIATLIVIARYVSRSVAAAFCVILLLAGAYIVPLSWQFVAVAYIALAGMVAAVLLGRKGEWRRFDLELFFILGIATVFFDFLTIPLITLGLPLLMALALRWRDGARRHATFGRDSRWEVLRASVAWVSGYALFWVTKWVASSLLLKQNVVKDAVQQIFLRGGAHSGSASSLSGGGARASGALGSLLAAVGTRFEGFFKNLAALVPGPATTSALVLRGVIAVALIAGAFALWLALRARRRRKGVELCPVRQASSFLLVAAFPSVWYFVLANHSVQNYYFTYRLLAVSLFAVALFFIATLTPEDKPGLGNEPQLMCSARGPSAERPENEPVARFQRSRALAPRPARSGNKLQKTERPRAFCF